MCLRRFAFSLLLAALPLARAEETLPDRQRFGLEAVRWAAFLKALDAPPLRAPRLKKLLQTPSVFER